MSKHIQFGLALLAILCLTTHEAAARGGRGGGGGGGMSRGGGGGFSGGGMSRPSPSMNRSPSMSRPSPSMSRPTNSMASRPSGMPPRTSQPISGTRPGSGAGVGSRPGVGSTPGARPGTGAISGARPGGAGGLGSASGARPGTGAIAGSRPSAGQLNDFLDIKAPGAGNRPSTLPSGRPGDLSGAVAGGVAGGAAADFLRGSSGRPSTLPGDVGRPGAGIGDRPGVGDRPIADRPIADRPIADRPITDRPGIGDRPIADRPGIGERSIAENRPDRIDNRQEWQDNRGDRRDEVRDQVRDNYPRLDFWSDYPGWAAWRINAPYRWATWGALSGWCSGYGWTESVPYSYGENVYYQDNSVYYGEQPVATAEEYAQQAETIIASAPEVAPEQAEWLPLGVFALTQDGQPSGPDPSLFLQLAISKEGAITGTLHNTATDTTQTVAGVADKGTQRVAWAVEGKTRPIMETGVVNLTEDTAPALVHFADGQTQQWLMVRLEEPSK